MSQDHNNPAFKKLLQKLQEESWQLELIISGFAIFGLISAYEPIKLSMYASQNDRHIYMFVISFIAYISCSILIFNLLLHVLLRGLWIGALGLRYISGDIDYEKLNYAPKFTRYLQKKIGSFDRYIATLENYCSVIFAVSFLLIFYVLAITFTIIAIVAIATYLISNESLPTFISRGFGITLLLFIIFGMFFTLIDFITQGFLKKKKWLAKIYFPIYWVFSFITLSFLYRPLVYNFLDNKFGKRLSLVLIPIYLGITIIGTFSYKTSNYLGPKNVRSKNHLDIRNYEDALENSKYFTNAATIQSKVITDPYLKVFLAFSETIEGRIYTKNPGLKPKKDRRGLSSDLFISINNSENNNWSSRKKDSMTTEYIKTFNEIYDVKIDSLDFDSEFLISKNSKEQVGFETYVNLKGLSPGKHTLKITRQKKEKDQLTTLTAISIPFWYFNE